MSCEEYLSLIDDLVEGELDAPTAGRVNFHGSTCSACREQFEAIKREKDVYARYLFDAEPPKDLWANFQMRLEVERKKTSRFALISASASARKTDILGSRRFPSLPAAGATLMIVFGIGLGWLKFAPSETGRNSHVAKIEPGDWQPSSASDETRKSGTADSPVKNNSGEKNAAAPQNKNLIGRPKSSTANRVSVADKKSMPAAAVRIERKTILADAGVENAAIQNRPDEEERRQRLQMKNLENEIAGQIERVELLLRSFRNARASETIESFDVGYEKGQARRLLEKNARLRRDAENYGILYAAELLNRVEPYLLDIANLADHPAPDEVLDIRERVKNQSVIAGLQIY